MKHTLPFYIALGLTILYATISLALTHTARTSAAPLLPGHLQASSDFTCDAVDEIPAIECEALVAFAPVPINGSVEWLQNWNWFTTNTPCTWYGVTCENGHISRLDFGQNGLEATLPPELGNLSQLTELRISGSEVGSVRGPIPPELGAATQLRILSIGSNPLSGPLPPELGNLHNLERLSFIGTGLTGPIPPEFGQLTNLEYIGLGYEVCGGGGCSNNLSGALPPTLGNLHNLREFHIAGNVDISGEIPQSFVELEALETFSYSATDLCVPANDSFQQWVDSVPDYRGTGVTCATSPVYSISGYIIDDDGVPVPGATLSIEHPTRSDILATTAASGLYTFTDLEPGTYSLSAQHERYTFTPSTIELTIPPARLQQNFVAIENEAENSFVYLPLVPQSTSQ